MIGLKMLLQSLLVSYVYAIPMPVMVGGQRDDNNCLTGAGYSWCESTQMCIRQWETPCDDNYNDCDDCLKRQHMGENIACPLECNTISPPIMIDYECPEVMCMIYCGNGRTKDENNCDTCSCNDDIMDQEQIEFHLERPQPVNPNIIPLNCISWHDGCNTCSVSNGELRGCTRMMCFREDNPHCLSFNVPNGH